MMEKPKSYKVWLKDYLSGMSDRELRKYVDWIEKVPRIFRFIYKLKLFEREVDFYEMAKEILAERGEKRKPSLLEELRKKGFDK